MYKRTVRFGPRTNITMSTRGSTTNDVEFLEPMPACENRFLRCFSSTQKTTFKTLQASGVWLKT